MIFRSVVNKPDRHDPKTASRGLSMRAGLRSLRIKFQRGGLNLLNNGRSALNNGRSALNKGRSALNKGRSALSNGLNPLNNGLNPLSNGLNPPNSQQRRPPRPSSILPLKIAPFPMKCPAQMRPESSPAFQRWEPCPPPPISPGRDGEPFCRPCRDFALFGMRHPALKCWTIFKGRNRVTAAGSWCRRGR